MVVSRSPSVDCTYDVFLSHNSADKPAVQVLAERLREAGLKPFLDVWHLTPGQSWQRELAEALAASASTAVFFGPASEGAWHSEEAHLALDWSVQRPENHRVIPVLLPGADKASVDEFLKLRTWVEFREGLDDDLAFRRLVAAIKGEAVEIGAFELHPEVDPYRGLERFEPEQAEFFHGRAGDTQRLVDKLAAGGFVAVVGASGSGKSSLVRAGLLPALARDAIPGSGTWHRIVFLPGRDPSRSLARRLASDVEREDRARVVDEIANRIDGSRDGLRDTIATWFANEPAPVLLVIDQFEEIFTHDRSTPRTHRREDDPIRAFSRNLSALLDDTELGIKIVVTLRADFLDRCLEYPELKDLLQDRQYLLGELGDEALREVIVQPAMAVGAFFEKGLVELILRDVKGQAGVLPLLQHALDELWRARRGPWLTVAAYDASGGVTGALRRRAQSTYEALRTDEERDIARHVLVRLTTLGEGVGDTRRRAARRELYPADHDPGVVDAVIGALSGFGARLIRADDETVEVTHEALIQHWDTLQGWLSEDRDALRVHRRLTESAEEWNREGRLDAHLYHSGSARLLETQEWAREHPERMNALERDFLHSSLELRRKARVLRAGVAGVVAVLAVVVLLVALEFLEARRSNRQQIAAGEIKLAIEACERAEFGACQLALHRAHAVSASAGDERLASAAFRIAVGWSQLAGDLLLADSEVTAVTFDEASTMLAASTEEGRVWIWDLATARPVIPAIRHDAAVHAVAFSADGQLLATGSADHAARVWATGRWERVVELPHGEPVLSVAFSPDGSRVITVGRQSVRIWEIAHARALGEPIVLEPQGASDARAGEPQELRSARYTGDGQSLVIRGTHGAWVWRPGDEHALSPYPRDSRRPIAYAPDGTLAATVRPRSGDHSTGGYETLEHRRVVVLPEPVLGTTTLVRFSPDGRSLFAATNEGYTMTEFLFGSDANLLRLGRDDVRTITTAQIGTLTDAAFSRDSEVLVVGDDLGFVQMSIVATGRPFGPRLRFDEPVRMIAMSPDGRTLAVVGERYVRLWNVHAIRSRSVGEIENRVGGTRMAASPDGRRLVVAGYGPLDLIDLDAGAPVDAAAPPEVYAPGPIAAVSFDPSGRTNRFVTGDLAHELVLWGVSPARVGGATAVRRWQLGSPVWAASFSPDGRRLVAGDQSGKVSLIQVDSGAVTPWLEHGGVVYATAFDAGGATVITGGSDGTAKVWSAESGNLLATLEVGDVVTAVAFTPNGRAAVTGSLDSVARIWDWKRNSERPRHVLRHDAPVLALAVHRDGQMLLTGGADDVARLWDMETGHPLRPPFAHDANVSDVAFTGAGSRIVTRTNRVVRHWEIPVPATTTTEIERLWLEIRTGHGTEGEALRPLSSEEWAARRERFAELGGQPLGESPTSDGARVPRSARAE